jgi:hypothetical protein
LTTTYVTGCDSKYFLMTGILLQAFKQYCPGRILRVCDFGLTDYQRAVFSHLGTLLERPPLLKENQHPWICKSSLIHYLNNASINTDNVVWMDSDCFPVGPFAEEIEKVAAEWGQKEDAIALCQGKVGKNWQLASPPDNIDHFSMKPEYPYYNSGMWILRSSEVLNEWAAEIESVPKNGMFEQDTFNYLLHKHKIKIQKLENDRWNVTHDGLNQVQFDPNGNCTLNGNKVLIIHITGDYTGMKVTVGPLTGYIRAIKKSELKHRQLQLLKEWVSSIHSFLKETLIPPQSAD